MVPADGGFMNTIKKAMFDTAIASVQTFDPYALADPVGRLAGNAGGVAAAAAVHTPELLKTEQRLLMDTGCPYDRTTRGSIPAEWHADIFQSEPVVLATANGEHRSVDRIDYPIAALSKGKARRS